MVCDGMWCCGVAWCGSGGVVCVVHAGWGVVGCGVAGFSGWRWAAEVAKSAKWEISCKGDPREAPQGCWGAEGTQQWRKQCVTDLRWRETAATRVTRMRRLEIAKDSGRGYKPGKVAKPLHTRYP